jgi:bla regulator protein BlaR1
VHLLLSWLWQGGLLALTAAALLLCIPRSRAQTRYWFVWVACLAVLVLPLMPYVSAAAAPQPSRGHVLGSIGPIVSVPAAWWTSPTAVLGLWAIWVTVCVVRLSIAVGEVRNARRHIRECPPDVHDRLRHWLRVRSTGRRSRLVLSSHVRSAAVFGCGSPVIAVSPRLLQTLRDQDLDRVVVHEWAHVQRRDDIAQIVQSVVRIVAGWHPAVWWLERRLTLEREVACDHVVVRVTGSAKEYAACLLTLATLPRRASRSVHALAVVSPGGVRRRIVRVVAGPSTVSAWRARAAAVSAASVLGAVALGLGQVHAIQMAGATGAAMLPASPALAPGEVVPTSGREEAVRSPEPVTGRRVRADGDPTRPKLRQFRNEKGEPAAANRVLADSVPAPISGRPLDARFLLPPAASDAASSAETPAQAIGALAEGNSSNRDQQVQERPRRPWAGAVEAGVAVGRGSRTAAVGVAGFFSRFGKQVSRSF